MFTRVRIRICHSSPISVISLHLQALNGQSNAHHHPSFLSHSRLLSVKAAPAKNVAKSSTLEWLRSMAAEGTPPVGKSVKRPAARKPTDSSGSLVKAFDKLPYLAVLLQDGKLYDTKLFPGFGPIKVSALFSDMGGPEKLLTALEKNDTSALVEVGKLRATASADMCGIWELLWSHFPEQTAWEMINLAGLAKEDLANFRSALEFDRDLKEDWFGTLQRLNTGRQARKRIEAFAEFHRKPLTREQKIALYAKSLLSESSQVCVTSQELIDLISREQNELGLPVPLFRVADSAEAKADLLHKSLSLSGRDFHLDDETKSIYLAHVFQCERRVARMLAERIYFTNQSTAPHLKYDASAVSAGLSPEQRDAVTRGVKSHLFLLTGGPGTGKTFCFGQMLRAWEHGGSRVEVASFTARSAQNLKDIAGAAQAMTIHKAFGASYPGAGFSVSRLDCDVFVLDEATMVDLDLFDQILSRLDKQRTALLLLGDPDQLPAVAPGSVFRDLFDDRLASLVPQARLREPRRQTGTFDSPIHRMAQMVNSGVVPDASCLTKASVTFFKAENLNPSHDRAMWINAFPRKETITTVVEEIFKRFSPDDVQVLVSGRAEVHNVYLKHIFRKAKAKQSAQGGHHRHRPASWNHHTFGAETSARYVVGDRVMHTKNDRDRDVMNGEIGEVVEVRPGGDVKVMYHRPDRLIEYSSRLNLGDLTLAYAMTVHKSQGCEFPVVVTVLEPFNLPWTKQMLFTACTRAKEWLFLVGMEQTLKASVATTERRNSNLVTNILDHLQVMREQGLTIGEVSSSNGSVLDEEPVLDVPKSSPAHKPSPIQGDSGPLPSASMASPRDFAVARFVELRIAAWTEPPASPSPPQPSIKPKGAKPVPDDGDGMSPEELRWLEEMASQRVGDVSSTTTQLSSVAPSLFAPEESESPPSEMQAKRPQGRPPKNPHVLPPAELESPPSDMKAMRPRGRPPKNPHLRSLSRVVVQGETAEQSPPQMKKVSTKGKQVLTSRDVTDEVITVPSSMQDGTVYEVNVTKKSCTCKGFQMRGRCKHLDAVTVK